MNSEKSEKQIPADTNSDKNLEKKENSGEKPANHTLASDLIRVMRITTDCRFESSKRLLRLNSISFLTVTFLSLGLILIPLLGTSKIHLYYSNDVLTAIQIFLAVAVLVYSVISSTANYAVRAKDLSRCADEIKDLVRDFKSDIASAKDEKQEIEIKETNKKYREITANSENHSDLDYMKVTYEMKKKDAAKKRNETHENSVTLSSKGFFNFDIIKDSLSESFIFLKIKIQTLYPFFIPFTMLTIEVLFITDMVGLTHIFGFLCLAENIKP